MTGIEHPTMLKASLKELYIHYQVRESAFDKIGERPGRIVPDQAFRAGRTSGVNRYGEKIPL
jgi:hypothetical protein